MIGEKSIFKIKMLSKHVRVQGRTAKLIIFSTSLSLFSLSVSLSLSSLSLFLSLSLSSLSLSLFSLSVSLSLSSLSLSVSLSLFALSLFALSLSLRSLSLFSPLPSLFYLSSATHLDHDGIKCLNVLRQERRDLVLVLKVAAKPLFVFLSFVVLALVLLAQGADYFGENVAAVAMLRDDCDGRSSGDRRWSGESCSKADTGQDCSCFLERRVSEAARHCLDTVDLLRQPPS